MRQQLVEFSCRVWSKSGFEIPPVFLGWQGQGGNQLDAHSQCNARRDFVRSLRQSGNKNERGRVALISYIIASQAHDNGSEFPLEQRNVLLSQIPVPRNTNHEGYPIVWRFHGDGD